MAGLGPTLWLRRRWVQGSLATSASLTCAGNTRHSRRMQLGRHSHIRITSAQVPGPAGRGWPASLSPPERTHPLPPLLLRWLPDRPPPEPAQPWLRPRPHGAFCVHPCLRHGPCPRHGPCLRHGPPVPAFPISSSRRRHQSLCFDPILVSPRRGPSLPTGLPPAWGPLNDSTPLPAPPDPGSCPRDWVPSGNLHSGCPRTPRPDSTPPPVTGTHPVTGRRFQSRHPWTRNLLRGPRASKAPFGRAPEPQRWMEPQFWTQPGFLGKGLPRAPDPIARGRGGHLPPRMPQAEKGEER